MRVVVTGAAGFIGSALLRRLAGHEVIAVIRPGCTVAGAECIPLDLSQPLDVALLPSRIDVVIHLAQSSRARIFPQGAADAFAVHVASTAALLDWATRAGASRFCLVSTGSVYEPYTDVM